MSIIEQAAKRLGELTRAGMEVPWVAAAVGPEDAEALAYGYYYGLTAA